MLPSAFHPVLVSARLDSPLSRWLWLIKWVLAVPHYLVIGFFTGAVRGGWWGGGLIGLLALIAVVTLAFTEKYPRDLFDLVIGLNRWVLRVAAYSGLMTDVYPPFRLDMGGDEPPDRMPNPVREA
ncbi:DUF4389 domain-containing protein [Streptomyces lavendulae]|uniref:DUF4389 domain-containing protein n=1 Tax=Streptomyces lavendulae TaxID=1914 RepID=UPI003F4D0CA0